MILVSDANVFIDLEVGELSARLFQLGHEIVVPDTLFEEELRVRHAGLLELGLNIRSLTPEQVRDALQMGTRYPSPSSNDLLALSLAKGLGCPLATGDKRLRAAADNEGVELCGTVTLIGEMLAGAIASAQEIDRSIGLMRRHGRRLPWDELEALSRGHQL